MQLGLSQRARDEVLSRELSRGRCYLLLTCRRSGYVCKWHVRCGAHTGRGRCVQVEVQERLHDSAHEFEQMVPPRSSCVLRRYRLHLVLQGSGA
eukprot:2178263-Rhodomonas_salina.1